MKPVIVGVTRVRNESRMIKSTLDHYGPICNGGIYAMDEWSVDGTLDWLQAHPSVRGVIRLRDFQKNPGERRRFEGWGRSIPLELAKAQHNNNPNLWVLVFDADERIEFDFDNFDYDACDAVSFRLFDYYITEEDESLSWEERQWVGPEYRDIPMLYRVRSINRFADRCPLLNSGARVHVAGYSGVVRHYGKALSEYEWEQACRYYTEFQPEPFKSKWEARKGKCVRRATPESPEWLSDFGNPLCRWEDREEYGFSLH